MKIKNSFINILMNNILLILMTVLCTIMYLKIETDRIIHKETIDKYKDYIQRLKDVRGDVCRDD